MEANPGLNYENSTWIEFDIWIYKITFMANPFAMLKSVEVDKNPRD